MIPVHVGGGVRQYFPGSLNFTKSIGEVGTGSIVLRSSSGTRHSGEHVRVYDSWGDSAFGGTIESVGSTRIAPGGTEMWYNLAFVSWENRLNKRYCGDKVYTTDDNAKERILDILGTVDNEGLITHPENFVDGATGADLGSKSYIGRTVLDACIEIAEAGGCVFYVDAGAFTRMDSRTDPVVTDLVFSSALKNFHEPVVTENRTDYLNRVKLAIAYEAFAPSVINFAGDGAVQTFVVEEGGVPVRLQSIAKLELNGVATEIVEATGNPDADWVFEYGTGNIKQNTALPPLASTDELKVLYYVIGINVITAEDSDDITARQAIEDDTLISASGIYEGYFEELSITSVGVGQTRAAAILKSRNPHQNGASAGTLPKRYVFKARGYIEKAEKIRPGYVITFQCDTPAVNKELLIETVSAEHTGYEDPSDPGVGGGFLLYTLTCSEFVSGLTAGDYLLSLAGTGGGGTGSGVSSGTGGGGPGGEVTDPAGNMTGLSVETKYVSRDGKWVRQELLRGTPPDPIGTFMGFASYLEEPDSTGGGTLGADGSSAWDGTGGLTGGKSKPATPGPKFEYDADVDAYVVDNLPPAGTPFTGRMYFASFNTSNQENPLKQGVGTGKTPSVTYAVPLPPEFVGGAGQEYAPLALNFRTTGPTPKYSEKLGGNQYWSQQFLFDNPTADPRYAALSGYQLWIEDNSGNRSQDLNGFTKLIGQPITSKDNHPVTAFENRFVFYLVSVDERGRANSILKGVTPEVQVHVAPQVGPEGEQHAKHVTDVTVGLPYYSDNGDGQRSLKIPGTFKRPEDDPRYGGAQIRLYRPPAMGTGPGGFTIIKDFIDKYTEVFEGELTTFPFADEPGCFVAVHSLNTNNWMNTYVEGVTPVSPLFTLPKPPVGIVGRERVDFIPTGFAKKNDSTYTNGLSYKLQDGGDWLYGIGVQWDKPDLEEIPRLGYLSLVIEYSNLRREYMNVPAFIDPPQWDSDFWPLYAENQGQAFKLWLTGTDANGRSNDLIPGVTPMLEFDPLPQLGGTGLEFGPNITGFTSTLTTVESSAGDEMFSFSGSWTVPSSLDPRQADVEIVIENAVGERTTVAIENVRIGGYKTDPLALPANSVWSVWAVPRNTNGKKNTIVSGITPKVAGLVAAVGGTGKLKASRLSPLTFNLTEFTFEADGKFTMGSIYADKVRIGSVLKVGGGPTQKVGQIGSFDASDVLTAWMGQQPNGVGGFWRGVYGQNAWFGGSNPTNANARFEGLFAQLLNTSFQITSGPVTVDINGVDYIKVTTTAVSGLNTRMTASGVDVTASAFGSSIGVATFGLSLRAHVRAGLPTGPRFEGVMTSSGAGMSVYNVVGTQMYGFDSSLPPVSSAFGGSVPVPTLCQEFAQIIVNGAIKKFAIFN